MKLRRAPLVSPFCERVPHGQKLQCRLQESVISMYTLSIGLLHVERLDGSIVFAQVSCFLDFLESLLGDAWLQVFPEALDVREDLAVALVGAARVFVQPAVHLEDFAQQVPFADCFCVGCGLVFGGEAWAGEQPAPDHDACQLGVARFHFTNLADGRDVAVVDEGVAAFLVEPHESGKVDGALVLLPTEPRMERDVGERGVVQNGQQRERFVGGVLPEPHLDGKLYGILGREARDFVHDCLDRLNVAQQAGTAMAADLHREGASHVEIDFREPLLHDGVGESPEFVDAVRDNLWHSLCADTQIAATAKVAFNVALIFFAGAAVFNPQEGRVIGVDTAEDFGMGLAVDACGVTLQRGEQDLHGAVPL